MHKKYPIQLNERIHLIDGFDLGVAERTGTYVINEEELTIIDPGPSPSVKHVKIGLEALGFSLDQVKYIIVTHVHLDHSGGAGLLIQDCPNATVVVHPRGARHLANPERLVAGAKLVYGERFSKLFEPIISIPADRLLVKDEGDTLEIGRTCTLKFLDTPGHAKHHFSIFDPISNGIFSGDTVGIRYEQLIRDDVNLFLPSTSPNQFDPDAMRRAIDRMSEMNLHAIYFGHYGMTDAPHKALQQVSEWLDAFMKEAENVVAEQKGHDVLAQRLFNRVREYLRKSGIPDDHEVYFLIEVDMQVSAMGMIDFLKK
ncbi:MBL fold metallo-hydrolase [Sporosarcina sp. JAI121]|uniref:MBL fold metallo-hydrolase n=1 Tax=Sporosarcina sp. JAI121 TaxID=2723064 RepID=UPI0015C77894|nr:MBL fold metallo-hydrolase [Sporosarcina sp. JAI121]NYF24819.1 glyoxylase-like metal-dependent hydrolase (beta-lactamase superfamily II) [Sporosarcina sp. JAI121]